MPFIADYIFDLALAELDTATTNLYICAGEPTSYNQATLANNGTTQLGLGNKAGLTISAPTDRAPSGRKVTVSAITDGSVTTTGTATHWAIVKTSPGNTLMATGALSASQAVTSGNTFTLAALDIGIADAT